MSLYDKIINASTCNKYLTTLFLGERVFFMKFKKRSLKITDAFATAFRRIDPKFKQSLSTDFEKEPIIDNLEDIQSGKISFKDKDFDDILPKYYRFCSAIQWTSFDVADLIADWLKDSKGKQFIDVGCGLGKLCLHLRLKTSLNINGIEQREKLVEIAEKILIANKIVDVNIFKNNVLDLKWNDYDIFYFFNPFYENIIESDILQIDSSIKFSEEKFNLYTFYVYHSLEKLPLGKVLITYHGFGKNPPPSWKLKKSHFVKGGFLEWWEKIK